MTVSCIRPLEMYMDRHNFIHVQTHGYWLRFYIPLSQHKIGHFRDVPQANLLTWYGKTKPNTTKAHIHQSKEMYDTKLTQEKLKTGLVASYDIRPGNGVGLFWFWCFINLSLTLTHLLTAPDPHEAQTMG